MGGWHCRTGSHKKIVLTADIVIWCHMILLFKLTVSNVKSHINPPNSWHCVLVSHPIPLTDKHLTTGWRRSCPFGDAVLVLLSLSLIMHQIVRVCLSIGLRSSLSLARGYHTNGSWRVYINHYIQCKTSDTCISWISGFTICSCSIAMMQKLFGRAHALLMSIQNCIFGENTLIFLLSRRATNVSFLLKKLHANVSSIHWQQIIILLFKVTSMQCLQNITHGCKWVFNLPHLFFLDKHACEAGHRDLPCCRRWRRLNEPDYFLHHSGSQLVWGGFGLVS